MPELFAKYPTLLQLQLFGGVVTLWFAVGPFDAKDPTTWQSEVKQLVECDPDMRADVVVVLAAISDPYVVQRPAEV